MEEGARLLSSLRRLFPGEEANTPAFNLLVRGIAQLAEASDQTSAANVILATRLKLLVLLGYAPEMGRCSSCGAEGPFCAFSPGLGGVVCESCWTGGAVATDSALGDSGPCFTISPGAVATLQVLIAKPLVELEYFDIDALAAAEVEHVLTQTLAYHGH
jgi:DNA repair protein RecO